MTSFSESPENLRRTAHDLDVALLHLGITGRVPRQPTIDLEATHLADGASLGALASTFLGS